MTRNAETYAARVTLGDFLRAEGLTAYKLAAAGRGMVSRNAVYALARGEADRVDLGTLSKLAALLEQLTGKRITLGDLMTLDRTA